jgi:hypothetical protein
MRELLQVIEMSVADARRAEELLERGARSVVASDTDRFLSMFGLWRSLGRIRVVRGMPRHALGARRPAA